MAQQLNVTLRNATGHRHVFSVTDNVCQVEVVNRKNLDDEELIDVVICCDDDARGSITYTMLDQTGARKDGITDGSIVDMD